MEIESAEKTATCPICCEEIVEATAPSDGQEAIQCEGKCEKWYHRWCAGVRKDVYAALTESSTPFFCPSCQLLRSTEGLGHHEKHHNLSCGKHSETACWHRHIEAETSDTESSRVKKWWFVIRSEEDLLTKLEASWNGIALQSAWKLQPVHVFDVTSLHPADIYTYQEDNVEPLECGTLQPVNSSNQDAVSNTGNSSDETSSTCAFFRQSACDSVSESHHIVEGASSHQPTRSATLPARRICKDYNYFTFFYFTAQSIYPKMDNLMALVQAHNPSMICIVETWLSSDIHIADSEISLEDYHIIRLDRNRHGGGVLIYTYPFFSLLGYAYLV